MGVSMGDRITLRFIMIGDGYLAKELFGLQELLNLKDFVDIIQDRRTIAAELVLRSTTLMIDPNPTYTLGTKNYPLAAYLGVPILGYNSSSAIEWTIEGQVLKSYLSLC